MENRGEGSAEPGGEREGGRAAGGEADRRGWLFPTRLFFFNGGGGCFLVALKETKKHSRNGTSPPKSRHGTPSPCGPARLAPELESSPRARSPGLSPRRPAPPHPGSRRFLRTPGRACCTWVGPARDGGAEGGRGRRPGRRGAQRRGRPPAARPRSPGRSRRGLTQCRAARLAESQPRGRLIGPARGETGVCSKSRTIRLRRAGLNSAGPVPIAFQRAPLYD